MTYTGSKKQSLILTILFFLTTTTPAAQLEGKQKEDQEGMPLKTTRTVEFTTDEGTWLSIDISPDGQRVVS